MKHKDLAEVLRDHAAEIAATPELEHQTETIELVRVLAMLVEGTSVVEAFGSPGGWGNTAIGRALATAYQVAAAFTRTITIQIGNSDNKLSQVAWSDFAAAIDTAVNQFGNVHFAAPSPGTAPWQNAAWVVELDEEDVDSLRAHLVMIRQEFQQDSIAWTEGETLFI